MKINCSGALFGSSIEDFDVCMARVIDKLLSERKVTSVIMAETRENEYGPEQTKMLVQVADAINRIVMEEKLISEENLDKALSGKFFEKWKSWLYTLVSVQLRGDPIGGYLDLEREIRHIKIILKRAENEKERKALEHYLSAVLEPIKNILEKTDLIKNAQPFLTGYHIGDRSVYRKLFHPIIRPNFMLTKFVLKPPVGGEIVDKYNVGGMRVEIFKVPGKVRPIYQITPAEFVLSEEEYTVLDDSRKALEERKPQEFEVRDQGKMRDIFHSISLELLRDIASLRRFNFSQEKLEELAQILTRYTTGLGVLELLLADSKIQDIHINSPLGEQPLFIIHQEFEECETNIIPTKEDGERWSTRFKLLSGRPLDEANPVLDTEISVPGGVARVAAIGPRVSPEGLAFAFRRHRFEPWTFPLFIQNRFFDPLTAGLLWFFTTYGRTLLVAGTRGSGKTSLLGSLMLQVIPYYRILTVEDSVTGDCELLVEKNDKLQKTTIGHLVDSQMEKYGKKVSLSYHEILDDNHENIKVFSMDNKGKIELVPVNSFIRHKTNKQIFEIRTRTGRSIKVTGDHSLFTIGKDGKICPIVTKDLKIGSYIATPRILPTSHQTIEHIQLTDYLEKLQKLYVQGESLAPLIKRHLSEIKEIAARMKYSKGAVQGWKRNNILPIRVCTKMDAIEIPEDVMLKAARGARSIPAKLELNKDILEFFGMWIADGCYDDRSVIISATDPATRALVERVGNMLNMPVKWHSDGWSLMLNSRVLKQIMEALDFKGNAYTKRVPGWIFSLSKEQKAAFLRGVFSGDGHISKSEFVIALVSERLLRDIQTLLLEFGIVSKISRQVKKDLTYRCTIGAVKWLRPLADNIGFLQPERNQILQAVAGRLSYHDTLDVVPLSGELKAGLSPVLGYHDYVYRGYNLGREKLRSIVGSQEISKDNTQLDDLGALSDSDIFWDEVAEIKESPKEEYVYDLSIFGNESFVCENIVAHNTYELPIEALRKLNYNVERMKSRSVITKVELELPAEEAIRTALRMGDSCLFIGEVRSREAIALYEAMRIGALANVVAGTIHGESAYGVFDRVVNDLGVPATSFKATDLIIVANKIRSADGLRSFRRVTEVTEVRKHWTHDPAEEHGFVNLLEYNSRTDSLKPTDTLLTGESMILNDIAKRVPGWAGRWDSVWDNIQLRAKVLQEIVRVSSALNKPALLEAPTVVSSNQAFHRFSESVRQEVGSVEAERVFNLWQTWFREQARRA